jgi:hypothetical protein
MAKKIVQAAKDKIAYEKESWRMSKEELKRIRDLDRKNGGK